jgi:hypothetical protein
VALERNQRHLQNVIDADQSPTGLATRRGIKLRVAMPRELANWSVLGIGVDRSHIAKWFSLQGKAIFQLS